MSESKSIVIGAGLPRTGTKSLHLALQELLNGRSLHSHDTEHAHNFWDFWKKFSTEGQPDPSEWKELIDKGNYVAVADSIHTYKDILKAYPESKVILTVRDPVSWYKSVASVILPYLKFPIFLFPFFKGFRIIPRMVKISAQHIPEGFEYNWFKAVDHGPDHAVQFFDKWAEHVKISVPNERLLIFNPNDGWEPLCKFLDAPIPDKPFPRVNTREEQADSFFVDLIKLVSPLAMGLVAYIWLRNRQK